MNEPQSTPTPDRYRWTRDELGDYYDAVLAKFPEHVTHGPTKRFRRWSVNEGFAKCDIEEAADPERAKQERIEEWERMCEPLPPDFFERQERNCAEFMEGVRRGDERRTAERLGAVLDALDDLEVPE